MTENGDALRVPAKAAAEYVAGFEDPVANLHDLEQSYELVTPSREHVLETARVAREGFRAGAFPGWADTQIAATAILYDEEIATANPGHFDGLGCEVWPYRDEVRSPNEGGEPK